MRSADFAWKKTHVQKACCEAGQGDQTGPGRRCPKNIECTRVKGTARAAPVEFRRDAQRGRDEENVRGHGADPSV